MNELYAEKGNFELAKEAADKIDEQIIATLRERKNFRVEAGAGSGKTYSLIKAIEWIQANKQNEYTKNRQKVICITFTNAAVDVIKSRLEPQSFILPSTIHSFAWNAIKQFQGAIIKYIEEDDSFQNDEGDFLKIEKVNYTLGHRYNEQGVQYLHHNDVLKIFVKLLDNTKYRKFFADKYPLVLIDEYQDTYKPVVDQFISSAPNASATKFAEELKELNGKVTQRLIVGSNKKINTMGAVGTACGPNGAYVLQYDSDKAVKEAYDYYNSLSHVRYVEYDNDNLKACEDTYSITETEITHNCVGKAISNVDDAMTLIKKNYTELPKIKVGVIDSGMNRKGIRTNRIDGGNSYAFSNFEPYKDGTNDDKGHGSKVGAIIANNTFDNVRLYSYQITDGRGNGVASYINSSLYLAADEGCKIINISYETGNQAFLEALEYAVDKGCIVIIATGNDGKNLSDNSVWAKKTRVAICVGNAHYTLKKASDTNYGTPIDFFAPGSDVYTQDAYGNETNFGGTSASAPFTSAIVALMLSIEPNLTTQQIESLVLSTGNAMNINKSQAKNEIVIDAYAILQQVTDDTLEQTELDYTINANSDTQTADVTFTSSDNALIYRNSTLKLLYIPCSQYDSNRCFRTGSTYSASSAETLSICAYEDGKSKSKPQYVWLPSYENDYDIKEETLYDPYNKLTNCSVSDTVLEIPREINGLDVEMIVAYLFMGNKNIETVILPETVKEIGEFAFANCANLKTVIAPGVEKCGQFAFYECPELRCVEMPKLTQANTALFKNCIKLTCLYTGTLSTVYNQAFKNCNSLDITNMTHQYEAVGYESVENDTMIMLECAKCGDEMQVSFMEHINTDYPLLDTNNDNIVNAKDLAYIINDYQRS